MLASVTSLFDHDINILSMVSVKYLIGVDFENHYHNITSLSGHSILPYAIINKKNQNITMVNKRS